MRVVTISLFLLSVWLAGCVASVKVVDVHDPRCPIATKKITASVEQLRAVDACSNEQCVVRVLELAASSVVAPIVAGSVTVVGNIVHWLEKSAHCRPAPASARPGGLPLE